MFKFSTSNKIYSIDVANFCLVYIAENLFETKEITNYKFVLLTNHFFLLLLHTEFGHYGFYSGRFTHPVPGRSAAVPVDSLLRSKTTQFKIAIMPEMHIDHYDTVMLRRNRIR